MRGFYGGVLVGLVLCAGALVAISVLTPLAPTPVVSQAAEQPRLPTGHTTALNSVATIPVTRTAAPTAPVALAPDPGDLGALSRIDNRVTSPPDFTTDPTSPAVPINPDASPGRPSGETPALPTRPESDAPHAPAQESGFRLAPSRDSAPGADHVAAQRNRLPWPDLSGGQGAALTFIVRDGLPEERAAPRLVDNTILAGRVPRAVTMPVAAMVSATAPIFASLAGIDAPVSVVARDGTPRVRTPAVVPMPDVEQAVQLDDLAQSTPLPQIDGTPAPSGPGIGQRVRPLTERGQPLPEAAPEALPPPIERFAEPFANPDGRPLLAIVLIDDGSAGNADSIPFPHSVAIDPAAPDAADRMTAHRAAGHEVLALVDLPGNFTASDTEVALAAGLDILDRAVGLLESAGMQANRDQSAQIVAVAKAGGRGLVTRPVGLNLTRRLAEQHGVPTAPVFRDFSGDDLDPGRMQRFLDAAVVRADLQGGTIVIGRLRPDTIDALTLWSRQNRAARVALAPVTAVLRQGLSTR